MFLTPIIYERTIESLLKKIKIKIGELVSRYELSPVLDLCCGTGKQAQLIHFQGHVVFGLDLDIAMLSFAQKKHRASGWICADAVRPPFAANSFNGIVLSYALHEKSERDRGRILSEVRRMLRPQGKLIFLDFENPWNVKSRLGGAATWLVERAAGSEHFVNGRRFLKAGGLRLFLKEHSLFEIKSYDIELGCSRIVVAQFDSGNEPKYEYES